MSIPAIESDGTVESSPLLVIGLSGENRSSMDWRESLTSIIRREWSSRRPSTRTQQAEAGLGIEGTPCYFYAMRTEHAFGLAVFLFREIQDTGWPEGVRGATPFDSGGFWHDKVHSEPQAEPHEKKALFLVHDRPLSCWSQAFKEYIDANYNFVDEYVEGLPPSVGTDPIIPGPPNTSRAWTWEVRVPSVLMTDGVELLRGFLSEEDVASYRDWLWTESDLDDGVCRSIEWWMQDNMNFAPPDEYPSTVAKRELLGVDVK